MSSVNEHIAQIRDTYAEALLSARLRGIEGMPAKHLALRETALFVQRSLGLPVTEDDLRRLLRVSNRAPFSMVMAEAPRGAGMAGAEKVVDQRINALLSQLNDTVLSAKA